MNRDFQTTSKRTRIAAVLVAILCTVLIGSGIDGLADHYHGQATQQAAHGQTTVAKR